MIPVPIPRENVDVVTRTGGCGNNPIPWQNTVVFLPFSYHCITSCLATGLAYCVQVLLIGLHVWSVVSIDLPLELKDLILNYCECCRHVQHNSP